MSKEAKLQALTHYLPNLFGGAFLLCTLCLILFISPRRLGSINMLRDSTRYVSWGKDIQIARNHIQDAPWATFAPIAAIFIFLIPFLLLTIGFYLSAKEATKEKFPLPETVEG